jgi:hypothetical protein
MVPVLVRAFLHFGSVMIKAQSITGTSIQNGARTGTVISALWFSTGKGKVHYRYWHTSMVPVPVLAFRYFDSVSALARDITGTGIKKYSTNKGNLHGMVWYLQQYHYWKITIIKLLTAI